MKKQVIEATKILKSGGLVAYPTESFYGLAADVGNEDAILRLFRVKKRQAHEPVLILIPSIESLERYVLHIPETAKRMIETFWPGGLTLVFKAGKGVSSLLTAGTGKIGVRLSSHPVAMALLHCMETAITGTSANISGEPPCDTADGVARIFGESVDKILDGGKTPGQKPSTVLDMTTLPYRILREGMISREALLPYCESLS